MTSFLKGNSTKKNPIWKYFITLPKDETKVKCTLCENIISRGGKGKLATNTPLHNHLKLKHKPSFLQLKDSESSKQVSIEESASTSGNFTQMTLNASFESKKIWDINDSKAVKMHYAIGEMIALDNQPYSIVSDIGFKRMLQTETPNYQVPSRNYFVDKIIPDIYSKCKNAIVSHLDNVEALSLTSDFWTCSYTNKSFLSLTGHWMTNGMDLQQAVLNVKYFPGSHTGEETANMLTRLCEEWKVEKNTIHLLIRDNASNIKKGCINSNIKSESCFIHTLQLIINSSLKCQRAIMDTIGVAKKMVGHFNHSSIACSEFEQIQRELHMKPKKLIQDVVTRWNSTYYMLERLFELKCAICVYAANNNIVNLNQTQWSLVESFLNLMKLFEEITRQMSKNEARLSEVIPTVNVLLHFLKKEDKSHFGLGTVKTTLKEELERRFKDGDKELENNSHYTLATILDPKFKDSFFSKEGKSKILELLHKEAQIISKTQTLKSVNENVGIEKQGTSFSNSEHDVDDPNSNSIMAQKKKKSSGFWECFEEISGQINKNNIVNQSHANIKNEIQLYLSNDLLDRKNSSLQWWKENASIFPNLKKLALKYLSAPASSVYSERLFSEMNQVCDNKRSSLTSDNLETLVFLNFNLKFLNYNY